MLDLKDTFLTAWSRIKPLLDANPDERLRRLARRHTARLQRPPREWCIALRANDLRLTPLHVPMVPDRAPARLLPHKVHLTAPVVRALTHPIDSGLPRAALKDFAKSLGVKPAVVLAQARAGQLELTRIKGLEHKSDRWGGIPLVSTARKPLAPGFLNRHRGPDPVWGTWWHDLAQTIPADFEQVIDRVPIAHADVTASHLPIAHTDPTVLCNPITFGQPARRGPRPPAPGPDHPRRFWGWRWLCPACHQTCRLLFYPTPVPLPQCITQYLKRHLARDDRDANDPAPTFACVKCHRVRGGLSWGSKDAWNHIVTLLSAGLLFGHEVEIPAFVRRHRKFSAPKRPQNRPSPKRHQVEQLLLQNLTYPQIAKELAISEKTVAYHTLAARKAHHVQTNDELKQRLRTTNTLTARPRSA